MSDDEVISAGKEIRKRVGGSWLRMRVADIRSRRPYELACFRFKSTLKAIEDFKQKEFNIESMAEQTLRHTVCIDDINRRAYRSDNDCSKIKGMLGRRAGVCVFCESDPLPHVRVSSSRMRVRTL